MALQVWLPLNGTLENKGLSNVTVTNNGATVDNNGKIGKCYKISNSHLIVPYTFTSTNLISIALWVKPSSASNWSDIFTFDSSKNRIEKSTTSLYYWYSDSNGLGASGTSLFNLEDNIWYHITYTFNGSTSSFYLNGILLKQLNSITNTLALALNGNKIYFGNRISGLTYSGYFNDIRIYNHCLSAKEVKEISKGLILHYKLDGNDIGITIPRNGGLIPDGVELYDYILSSGTLWIDTGVALSLTDKFEFETDFTYSPANNRACPFYGTENYLTGFMAQYHYTSNTLYVVYIKGALFGGSNVSITASSRMYSKTVIDVPNKAWATTYNTTSYSGTYSNLITDTTSTVKFFGNDLYNKYVAKCYYFKIKRNDLLIRNFLPCTYLGEPGMWDTVENKFYRNQGTGLFTLGNKITLKEYEYLLSSGTLYIDTLYNPNNNTRVLTELMMTTNGDAQGMFGSYSGNNWTDRSYGLYYAGSSGNAYSNYVSDTVFPRSKIPYNIKHLIDKNKNLLYIDNALVLTHSTATFQASISMHIFKLNFSSLPRYANMRLYTFKIWDNNTLVRDFIPVSYNGTPGLWDKVEWKFYANAGSGSFTLGPEKTVQQDAPIFYDSSGYCNHGSITGTLTTNNDSPRYTNNIKFGGHNCYILVKNPFYNNVLPCTFAFWFKPNASNGSYNTIVSNTSPHNGFWIGGNNESTGCWSYNSGTYIHGNAGTKLTNGQWYHMVWQYKGNNQYQWYLNGEAITTTISGTAKAPTFTEYLNIGGNQCGDSSSGSSRFDQYGNMSDLRIYSSVLSADDIKELYNTSAFVTNNGVFAEYELYEDNLSDVKKTGLLETANFYENGAESGYALDTDKTRVASNYIISEDFIEI